jgi:hypothetical protein
MTRLARLAGAIATSILLADCTKVSPPDPVGPGADGANPGVRSDEPGPDLSAAPGVDLFEPYVIAAAAVQLEDDTQHFRQFAADDFVESVAPCDRQFADVVDAWLVKTGLTKSRDGARADGRIISVDVVQPAEGLLFLAYLRFDEGRRAALSVRLDTNEPLGAGARAELVRLLQLVQLYDELSAAIKCDGSSGSR